MSEEKCHLQRLIQQRHCGQSNRDYYHSTACGYVRNTVTSRKELVTCKLCLREIKAMLSNR
jgi:hypothetical protein